MHIVHTLMKISIDLKNWSFLTTKRAIAAMRRSAALQNPFFRNLWPICYLLFRILIKVSLSPRSHQILENLELKILGGGI